MTSVKFPNGLEMPMMGFGTYFGAKGDFTEEEVYAAVKQAIDVGYRHFDTAWLYETERPVGRAIKEKIADGTVNREDLFVTTKLSNGHHDLVRQALRESLDNLGLDYVDLYLIHMPMALKLGPGGRQPAVLDDKTEMHNTNDHLRTWKEMEAAVENGLVRSIGVSNFSSKQVQNILDNCSIKPANNQVEAHLYLANDRLINYCLERGVTITAYTPLGQPHSSWRPDGFGSPLDDPVVKEISKTMGRSPAQIALRYQIQRGVAVIAKSSNPQRLRQNLEIFDFTLTESQMKALRGLDRNQRANYFKPLAKHKDYFLNEEF